MGRQGLPGEEGTLGNPGDSGGPGRRGCPGQNGRDGPPGEHGLCISCTEMYNSSFYKHRLQTLTCTYLFSHC